MKRSFFSRCLLLMGSAGLFAACTATEETSAESRAGNRAPSEIQTDADRQAAYNRNVGVNSATPDATPRQVPIGEQASGTNARQRVESINTNGPSTTSPETRMQRLKPSPPADTLRPLPPR